jgi:serine/threonine-protein kinase
MSDSTKYEESPESRERPPAPENPKPGDVLVGKYRIGRILGEGGMGIVVEAMHLQLRQPVALKFMLPKALGNKEAIARFEREARAAVRLKSPHVAKVLDTGTLENGAPYMVMEYLEGRTLSSLVRQTEGGLPEAEAIEYFLQACEGVAEAHALGVVHRDLKPSNMFLTTAADGSPTIKVLDFGVSKLGPLATTTDGGESEGEVTKTEAVVGSPLYMSPEQMKSSRDVDHRTDVWSLGVSLFEMLTGKVPFVADSIHQQYTLLMVEAPPKPSDRRPGLSPGLDDVVLRCLQREREARFADVGELAAALAPFAPESARSSIERIQRTLAADRSGKSGPFPRVPSIPPRGGSTSRDSVPAVKTPPPPPPTPRTDVTWGGTTTGKEPPRRSRAAIIVVSAVALAAVGVVLVLSLARGPSPVDAPIAPATSAAAPSATTPEARATAPASAPTASAAAPATVAASAPPSATAKTTARPTGRPNATAKPSSDTVDLTHRK